MLVDAGSGNIGLHHVHHARPTIPNYNLQQCYDDISPFGVRAIRWNNF